MPHDKAELASLRDKEDCGAECIAHLAKAQAAEEDSPGMQGMHNCWLLERENRHSSRHHRIPLDTLCQVKELKLLKERTCQRRRRLIRVSLACRDVELLMIWICAAPKNFEQQKHLVLVIGSAVCHPIAACAGSNAPAVCS